MERMDNLVKMVYQVGTEDPEETVYLVKMDHQDLMVNLESPVNLEEMEEMEDLADQDEEEELDQEDQKDVQAEMEHQERLVKLELLVLQEPQVCLVCQE